MAEERRFPLLGSPYVPLLIVVVGLVVLEIMQTVSLIEDRGILTSAQEGQGTAFAESERMRQQLESLAGKVALLAQSGDADAKAVVAEYARRGINIVAPNAVPASPNPTPNK